MTKVLFVYPYVGSGLGYYNFGIGFISSLLKKNGHKTYLKRINVDKHSKKELIKKIEEVEPDLIAFSFPSSHYLHVKLFAKWIKEEFNIPILCGGVHTTLCPDEVLSDENVDMVCVGEGEYPMLELANNIDNGKKIKNIKNMWFKNKKNPIRPLISNLDELPFPDRELFDYSKLLKVLPRAEFMAGRGCPFNCTYCCNHILKNICKGGRYVRIRSIENVLSEIREVTENYDVKMIQFHDDTFTLFPKWIKNFCKKYKENFDIKFVCNGRIETITKEVLIALKDAGCEAINIGVETGNEWLRKEILNRKMNNEQILNVFKMTKEVGLETAAFYMVGLPYETPEMIEETIKFNEILSPDRFQVSIFYPYPETELWHICKKEGFLTDRNTSSYFRDSIVDLPTITRKQIEKYYRILSNQSIDMEIKYFFKSYPPFISKIFEKLSALVNHPTKRLIIDMFCNIREKIM